MTGLDFFTRIYPAPTPLTVFDVGAHAGDSVASFRELFPRAKIHAFEPAPENFRRLHARFAASPGINCHPTAVGATTGRVQLHLNNYDATHSVLPLDPVEINRWADSADVTQTGTIEVAQCTIASAAAEHAVAQIDILKMDVQGGEMLVLDGAQSLLATHRIDCIFSEVEFRTLYTGQPLAWDIHRRLAGLGYEFVNFACPKLTDAGCLSWADAIYVSPAIWAKLAARHSAGKMR
jgi:FkbM family methyltransferase